MIDNPSIEELTWECRKGDIGNYEEMSFEYQGCGVMEPRIHTFHGKSRVMRRSCECEQQARKRYEQEEKRREYMAFLVKQTYGWLGEKFSDFPLQHKTFANFRQEYQPAAVEAVQLFMETPTGTLILHGSFGTGKTHLLSAMCNAFHRRNKSSLFVKAPKLFRAVQECIVHNESFDSIVTQAKMTPLLVIDDIDKAKHSPFREDIYFEIIDDRVDNGRPIAISTNRFSELADYVGGACASRLSINALEIEMIGRDYRKEL